MFGWRRKVDEIAAAAAMPEDIKIEFRSDDSMHQRAEKIWYALGMANDRFGAIPQIAGWLSMYRDWDQRRAKYESHNA